jgi:hypothetical protein
MLKRIPCKLSRALFSGDDYSFADGFFSSLIYSRHALDFFPFHYTALSKNAAVRT